MVIKGWEVYSENGNRCIFFLTLEEAKEQNLIAPSDGPYEAGIEMTKEEYADLREKRHRWV